MDVGTALSLALQMLPGPERVAHRPPPTAHRLGCSEPGAGPAVIKPF